MVERKTIRKKKLRKKNQELENKWKIMMIK